METKLLNAVIAGTPGITLNVSAADLEAVIAGFVRNERNRVAKELEEAKNAATLTPKQVAKMLKVGQVTLWRWNKEGYLKAVKVGRRTLYRMADVEKLMSGINNG